MTTPYSLLVFDWDGTLMDSSAKIVNCFAGAARDMNMSCPDPKQVKRYIGLSLVEAFSLLYPKINSAQANQLVDRYRDYWLVHDNTAMELFSGVRKGLIELQNAGYLLAVATGKSRRGLERAMDTTNLDDLFVYTRCADQSRPKPDPAMLLDILDYTGLEKREAVMIGDTTFDMQMAGNAGVNGWGVSYGSHDHAELQALSRHPVLENFSQLAGVLLGQDCPETGV